MNLLGDSRPTEAYLPVCLCACVDCNFESSSKKIRNQTERLWQLSLQAGLFCGSPTCTSGNSIRGGLQDRCGTCLAEPLTCYNTYSILLVVVLAAGWGFQGARQGRFSSSACFGAQTVYRHCPPRPMRSLQIFFVGYVDLIVVNLAR